MVNILRSAFAISVAVTLAACNTTTGTQSGVSAASDPNSEIMVVNSTNSYGLVDQLKKPTPSNEVIVKLKITFPDGADQTTKYPAMVFVHGSGGPLARHQKWLSLFRSMGIVTIQSNHFESRGITSSVGDQTRVTGSMMTGDALHILNALVRHPRVDPKRIGIMGGSKGGTAAYSVAWEPLRAAMAGGNMYAAHIPLYPSCTSFEDKTFTNKPMLMMIGDKDNYTGVDQCVEYADELKQAGYSNLTVKLYPDAYHGFDDDRGIRDLNEAYSVVGCKFVIRADGTIYDATSGLSLDDPVSRRKAFGICAKKDTVRLGGNHVMPQAMKDVREFLTRALAL